MDYYEYINLINKLWNTYSESTSDNLVLPTRA